MSSTPRTPSGRFFGLWMLAFAVLWNSLINSNYAQDTPAPGAGVSLQMQLDIFANNIAVLYNRIIGLYNSIDNVNATLIMARNTANAAAAAAAAAQGDLDDEIIPGVLNVTNTAGKMVNINKTWKTNFKIMNTTFKILRKKLSFRAPRILGTT